MQNHLNDLLRKYSVDVEAKISPDGRTVTIDQRDIPLPTWQHERRFIELRNTVQSGRIGGLCTYRIAHTAGKNESLSALLYREIGILEFTTDSKVTEIFAVRGPKTMNCIAETENGCVCTIELAATLPDNTPPIDKHEIIADNGVACDRAVDTQIPQSSIYVFGGKNERFSDTDFELFGLSQEEINSVRCAFSAAKSKSLAERYLVDDQHLRHVVACAKQSLDLLENIRVEG